MRYLTVEEILLIHEFEVHEHGGVSGIRSIELLESSVHRPKTSFSGKELYKTVFEKAACLIHTIIKNHPFIDGNKRTAMVSGAAFLALNGYALNLSHKDFVKAAIKTANDALDINAFANLLKHNSKKV